MESMRYQWMAVPDEATPKLEELGNFTGIPITDLRDCAAAGSAAFLFDILTL